MTLTWLDWLLMLVYFAFVLGIGAALKNRRRRARRSSRRDGDSGVGLRPRVHLGPPGRAIVKNHRWRRRGRQ